MGLLFGTPVDVDGRHVRQLTGAAVPLLTRSTSRITYAQGGSVTATTLAVSAGSMHRRREIVIRPSPLTVPSETRWTKVMTIRADRERSKQPTFHGAKPIQADATEETCRKNLQKEGGSCDASFI
jgi:hypothetical protein